MLGYETGQSTKTIEQEEGVKRHTHNGIDTPRIKFSDLDKYTERYSLKEEFGTPYPGYAGPGAEPIPPSIPTVPVLTGDYATDYTDIQTYLNNLNTYFGSLNTYRDTMMKYIAVSDYWIREIIMITLDQNKLTQGTDEDNYLPT